MKNLTKPSTSTTKKIPQKLQLSRTTKKNFKSMSLKPVRSLKKMNCLKVPGIKQKVEEI